MTAPGTLAESCVESNGPYEMAGRASSVNGERNNECATRLMVSAVTQVPDPNGTLLLAWPAIVTGAVGVDASPASAEAAKLADLLIDAGVDVVVDCPTAGEGVARETNGSGNGEETAPAGKDAGW